MHHGRLATSSDVGFHDPHMSFLQLDRGSQRRKNQATVLPEMAHEEKNDHLTVLGDVLDEVSARQLWVRDTEDGLVEEAVTLVEHVLWRSD
jgi:hypothetical protein